MCISAREARGLRPGGCMHAMWLEGGNGSSWLRTYMVTVALTQLLNTAKNPANGKIVLLRRSSPRERSSRLTSSSSKVDNVCHENGALQRTSEPSCGCNRSPTASQMIAVPTITENDGMAPESPDCSSPKATRTERSAVSPAAAPTAPFKLITRCHAHRVACLASRVCCTAVGAPSATTMGAPLGQERAALPV